MRIAILAVGAVIVVAGAVALGLILLSLGQKPSNAKVASAASGESSSSQSDQGSRNTEGSTNHTIRKPSASSAKSSANETVITKSEGSSATDPTNLTKPEGSSSGAVAETPGQKLGPDKFIFKAEPLPASPSKQLRLAVTPPAYDDMGKLLMELGAGYEFTAIEEIAMRDERLLSKYDVVFFTCNGSEARRNEGIRRYVQAGGTLYASDLRFDAVSATFPEFLDKQKVGSGRVQNLEANVLDSGLKDLIGDKVKLTFNAGGWRPAAFRGSDVTVYVEGEYSSDAGAKRTSPLLVKFPIGKGKVIFTSFHNAVQNSDTVLKILRYLVFSAVATQVEEPLTQTLVANGYWPAKKDFAGLSKDAAASEFTFKNENRTSLQFALGFQGDKGIKLRFTATAPNGQKFEQDTVTPMLIDIIGAPAGEWRYSLTALECPYPNYPVTLLVGRSLVWLGSEPNGIPLLIETLRDDRKEMRRAASQSLAKVGNNAILSLMAALQDPNANVRLGVVDALGAIGPNARGAIDALKDIAAKDNDPTVRKSAAEAIDKIGK